MPVIKSAQKKLRQSRERAKKNRLVRSGLRDLATDFRRNPSQAKFPKLVSALSKAAKSGVIHKNKASRLTSRLAKLLAAKAPVKPAATKKTPRRTA